MMEFTQIAVVVVMRGEELSGLFFSNEQGICIVPNTVLALSQRHVERCGGRKGRGEIMR